MHLRHANSPLDPSATHVENLTSTERAFVVAVQHAVGDGAASATSERESEVAERSSCFAFIASDRTEAIARMAASLHGVCRVITASREGVAQGPGVRPEHGLYTGLTFMVER